jgi:hypothetical protein
MIRVIHRTLTNSCATLEQISDAVAIAEKFPQSGLDEIAPVIGTSMRPLARLIAVSDPPPSRDWRFACELSQYAAHRAPHLSRLNATAVSYLLADLYIERISMSAGLRTHDERQAKQYRFQRLRVFEAARIAPEFCLSRLRQTGLHTTVIAVKNGEITVK